MPTAFLWLCLEALNREGDCLYVFPADDRGGYDVVMEANGIIRHVQLKSSFRGSKVREVDVSTKLLRKPGGCILWLEFDADSLAIERYYWFGGRAGAALPDLGLRVSRHSKGNSEGEKTERPIHRVLTKGRFEALPDISDVIERLFSPRNHFAVLAALIAVQNLLYADPNWRLWSDLQDSPDSPFGNWECLGGFLYPTVVLICGFTPRRGPIYQREKCDRDRRGDSCAGFQESRQGHWGTGRPVSPCRRHLGKSRYAPVRDGTRLGAG